MSICVYMHMYSICARGGQETAFFQILWTGITEGCELPCGCWSGIRPVSCKSLPYVLLTPQSPVQSTSLFLTGLQETLAVVYCCFSELSPALRFQSPMWLLQPGGSLIHSITLMSSLIYCHSPFPVLLGSLGNRRKGSWHPARKSARAYLDGLG